LGLTIQLLVPNPTAVIEESIIVTSSPIAGAAGKVTVTEAVAALIKITSPETAV